MRRILSFFLAAAFLVSQAQTQSNPGAVKGTLTDESGAVIPAATVTLTGNGGAKTAQSQADGSYSFTDLAPGQYTVNLNFIGFAPFSRTVTVAPGLTVQLPIRLSLSTETQRVTVSAEPGPTVSTEPDNKAAALVIRGEDLQALPDDPDDLSAALQALAGPERVLMEARSISTASRAGSCRLRNLSARYGSIKTHFRPNTTGWVSDGSRSSPGPERTSFGACYF
jgi:hypothetical protein